MLRMVPLPILRWGGNLVVAACALRWGRRAATAGFVLRRWRSGGRVLGRGQPAVAVCVELGERLVARREDLVGFDLSILVLVGAGEASLLAALGAGFGRLQRGREQGPARCAGGWCGWKGGIGLGPALPEEKHAGQEQKGRRRPGKKTRHEAPPKYREIRRHLRPKWTRLCQLGARKVPAKPMTKHRRGSPGRSLRFERLAAFHVADGDRGH